MSKNSISKESIFLKKIIQKLYSENFQTQEFDSKGLKKIKRKAEGLEEESWGYEIIGKGKGTWLWKKVGN